MSKPEVKLKVTAEGKEASGTLTGSAGAKLGVKFTPGIESGVGVSVDDKGNTVIKGSGDFTVFKKGDFQANLQPEIEFDTEDDTLSFQGGLEMVLSPDQKLTFAGGSEAGDPFGKVAFEINW